MSDQFKQGDRVSVTFEGVVDQVHASRGISLTCEGHALGPFYVPSSAVVTLLTPAASPLTVGEPVDLWGKIFSVGCVSGKSVCLVDPNGGGLSLVRIDDIERPCKTPISQPQ